MDLTSIPGPSTCNREPPKIRAGDTVLLRAPRGNVRAAKIEVDSTISMGRQGSFSANELIGNSFGLTYEIAGKKLNVLPPRNFLEIEDTEATNELINDSQLVQLLTSQDIEELKRSGVHASDIIKKQIEQHANFSLKSEYSKEKYKKRKEDKYLKSFTTLEPTIFNVCDYWFNKDKARIRDIRIDTLSQMMNLANIRPGGRYLVVDDASGIVVSAILDRMGGEGRLISICDVDGPPAYAVMAQMNFKENVTSIHASLNWSTAQMDYAPAMLPFDPLQSDVKSAKHQARLKKRKIVTDYQNGARKDLFAGAFEALLVSSEYDPFSIIEMLSRYLAGSANIVIQSPYVQVLADLQVKLRQTPRFLAPILTEAWLRRYQVLPGRTHPLMNMPGSGGYLLHTTYVNDDPSASAATSHRTGSKWQMILQNNVPTSSDGGESGRKRNSEAQSTVEVHGDVTVN